jgi:hypothetical protein
LTTININNQFDTLLIFLKKTLLDVQAEVKPPSSKSDADVTLLGDLGAWPQRLFVIAEL